MSAFSFERAGGEAAVEAWRPLDRALYRWVVAHGGDAVLAATAAWASLAEGNGDTALPLADGRHGMEPLTEAEQAQLRASPLVATDGGQGVRPFVLEGQRFYLWRNHAHEVAAAQRIRERREAAVPPSSGTVGSTADLDALFHGDRSDAVGPQRDAVRRAAGKRLFVLTGGPGTGKTTTVLRMLLMLQRGASSPLSIRIAAPTGKAAQRLVQALRKGKATLRDHPDAALPEDWLPWLDTIPDAEALTVHRLLGYEPWRNAFRRNARDPVAADVVVVDEASMIDLAMLRSLLDAVRPDAMLILVGDADQLTSVATGSVLFDLVSALEADPRGDLVRLAHSFRAERHLVAVNEAVRRGDADALAAALAASEGRAVLHPVEDERALREQVARWANDLAAVAALRPVLPSLALGLAGAEPPEDEAALRARADLVHGALAALADRQILCALRETPFGAVAINALLESFLRRAWNLGAQSEWYPGRAVIVTRNDYAAGLFNGDVGVCLADAAGNLRVWFEGTDTGNGGIGLRSFAPHTLPTHETAFAITIHKSQGSEYRHAAVVLPPDAEHRILSRQLLYTGVSRAKQSVDLWSTPAALQAALAIEIRREGGLETAIRA